MCTTTGACEGSHDTTRARPIGGSLGCQLTKTYCDLVPEQHQQSFEATFVSGVLPKGVIFLIATFCPEGLCKAEHTTP